MGVGRISDNRQRKTRHYRAIGQGRSLGQMRGSLPTCRGRALVDEWGIGQVHSSARGSGLRRQIRVVRERIGDRGGFAS